MSDIDRKRLFIASCVAVAPTGIVFSEKTHKLNVLHAWWPGGLIVGGVVAYTLTRVIPSLITNLTGMQGILILIYTAGLAFALRFFAGGLAHRMSPLGLLAGSSLLSMAGLYALGTIDSAGEAFVAATLFGVGTAYFWPTMLSVTSELFPRGGAFLLALMGGAGNLAIAFVLPVIGGWYDTQGAAAAFRYVAVLPAMLTVIFVALFIHYQSRGGYRPVALAHGRNVAEGAS
jgi:MFS family permease